MAILRKGGPLIDFINAFLEEPSRYVGTYYRHGDDGYWEIMFKGYDKANHVPHVKATGKVTHITEWDL